mmetsp:Transcript_71480/g.221851  ORF Transcript_71480/g.221851 Transcript_71480/m.221851 type:complete len:256 (-) Transcript_71480:499-1266(-)
MRYCIHAWSVLLLCCRFHVSFSQAVKEAGGGNPECWKSGFSYELCCKTGEHGKNNNCWNIHFNYDLCCFDPFRPSDQCFQAKDTEELLWHCRIRPNREFNRCLGVTMGAGEGHGWLGWFHDEYEAYAKAQREKTNRELHVRFATERVLESVSMYLKRHFSTSNGMRKCLWGLCHGAKTGEDPAAMRMTPFLARTSPWRLPRPPWGMSSSLTSTLSTWIGKVCGISSTPTPSTMPTILRGPWWVGAGASATATRSS